MRIPDMTDDAIRDLVRTARDSGIDFFDHADVYGGELHRCEERFAEALALTRPSASRSSCRPRPASSATVRTSTSPTST